MLRQQLKTSALVAPILCSILASFLNSAAATAADGAVSKGLATIPDKANCTLSPIPDQYENPTRITVNSSLYADKCFNSMQMRPVQIRSKTTKSVTIANFQHKGEFWIAEIPTAAADFEKMYFQIVRFPVVKGVEAAHGQIRVKLKTPIRLTSQTNPNKTDQTSNFIMSAEAGFPQGESYNFAIGAYDNYPLVLRVISVDQTLDKRTNPVEQYELNLNGSEISGFTTATMERSNEKGNTSFYNTLRPNCVSEAIDLLDLTPRLKGKNEPFMAVLWTDPVAGPALKALEKRKVLINGTAKLSRFADLADDYVRGLKNPPASANIPVPDGVIRHLNKVRLGVNPKTGAPVDLQYVYSVVTVSPSSKNSAAVKNKIVSEVQKSLTAAMPELAQSMIVPVMLGGGTNAVVQTAMKKINERVQVILEQVNERLTDKPITMAMYLTPWDESQTRELSLAEHGVSANLPFKGAMYTNRSPKVNAELLNLVHTNLARLQKQEALKLESDLPAFFLGAAIQLRLVKDKSTADVQALASFSTPQNLPFATGGVVVIDKLNLPSPEAGTKGTAASMLLSHTIKYREDFIPKVNFSFGSFLPMATNVGSKSWGLFLTDQKKQSPVLCNPEKQLVPTLKGVVGKDVSGIKWVDSILNKALTGRPIAIGIYGFDLVYGDLACDVEGRLNEEWAGYCKRAQSSVSKVIMVNADVRATLTVAEGPMQSPLRLTCVSASMMDTAFEGEATASIDMQIKELVEDNRDKLSELINGAAKQSGDPRIQKLTPALRRWIN